MTAQEMLLKQGFEFEYTINYAFGELAVALTLDQLAELEHAIRSDTLAKALYPPSAPSSDSGDTNPYHCQGE